jgi:hypothetical protein
MSFWKCNRCKGDLKTPKEKFLKTCNSCALEAKHAFDEGWEEKSFNKPKEFFFGKDDLGKEKFDQTLESGKNRKKILKQLKKKGVSEEDFKSIIRE